MSSQLLFLLSAAACWVPAAVQRMRDVLMRVDMKIDMRDSDPVLVDFEILSSCF